MDPRLQAGDALLIIDVQRDFLPGGSRCRYAGQLAPQSDVQRG